MLSSSLQSATMGSVCTMHILHSGELINSLEDFQKVEDRFSWVNRRDIISKLLQLRNITDQGKKSIIAIYEDRQIIREYVNVDENFKPLLFR